jgi:protein-glutamine gamma-glutamyltransferase
VSATRSPRPIVPPRAARLAALTLLAGVGSLQWVRYVEGASAARALAWTAAATLTGVLVLLAGRRPLALAGAVVAGAALAVGASGLDLTYLEPRHLDELGAGIARGAEALNSVRLPYLGREPWVLTTVNLAGAGLCWAAAALACWPGGRGRLGALVLLLTLAASPIVSLGADSPTLLGLGLFVLTAAFLWLERLVRRPGLGLAVLALAVALTAVPLGAAADREEPWFDYKAFAERLSGGAPITFDWNHEYGPIDWGREGAELFRVRSERPHYWKVETLNDFDGRLWTDDVRRDLGEDPEDDLPASGRREEWETTFDVSISRLETEQLVGAGTTLEITGETQPVEEAVVPGQWVAADGRTFDRGDSYTARAYVPPADSEDLAVATVGRDPRRAASLLLDVDWRPERLARAPRLPPVPGRPSAPQGSATVMFPPFETGNPPTAAYRTIGFVGSGRRALRNSYYARTWELAQYLKRNAFSPYEYVLNVNAYLRGSEFRYTEAPPPTPAGEAPLEFFLFDSKAGYCQQYSGAMALLLRMGGVPARVATGFSPGGLRSSSGEWVVRDTDAHSWVEVWFDRIGWVTFDPTPPQTPARSQIAAIAAPVDEGDTGTSGDFSGRPLPGRDPAGPQRGAPGAGPLAGGGGASGDDGTPWPRPPRRCWRSGASAAPRRRPRPPSPSSSAPCAAPAARSTRRRRSPSSSSAWPPATPTCAGCAPPATARPPRRPRRPSARRSGAGSRGAWGARDGCARCGRCHLPSGASPGSSVDRATAS